MAKRKPIFQDSYNIRVNSSLAAAEQLSNSVQQTVALIERFKPKLSRGIFIDTSCKDGKVLQGFINNLGDAFHYYAYEGGGRYASASLSVAERNVGMSCLSVRVRGISNSGDSRFSLWLTELYKMYKATDQAPPFIVLKMNLNVKDYKALDMLRQAKNIEKIGMLVAAFRGPIVGISKEIHPRIEAELRRKNVPIVDSYHRDFE